MSSILIYSKRAFLNTERTLALLDWSRAVVTFSISMTRVCFSLSALQQQQPQQRVLTIQ